jgi:hypothetical protein
MTWTDWNSDTVGGSGGSWGDNHTFNWDGHKDGGKLAPTGRYRVRVSVTATCQDYNTQDTWTASSTVKSTWLTSATGWVTKTRTITKAGRSGRGSHTGYGVSHPSGTHWWLDSLDGSASVTYTFTAPRNMTRWAGGGITKASYWNDGPAYTSAHTSGRTMSLTARAGSWASVDIAKAHANYGVRVRI